METKKKPVKFLVMAVLLGLLIVVSAVQAVELVNLKNKVDTELSSLPVSKPAASAGSPSDTLQNSIQNLPSMVGGC
jgi:hypothetical protein